MNIPPYVYREKPNGLSLLQGDILKVEKTFHTLFSTYYPAIKHTDNYVMVLTQSCDLVNERTRKPKLKHINVCPVRSLKSYIEKYMIEEVKPYSTMGKTILEKNALDKLKDTIYKLLNNTEQKTHFFLPKQLPFTENMVAIIPLSFSFRTEHYSSLLENRVLGLKPEFQAKVGHIISQLYGRIGTMDLAECDWDDKKIRNYIKELLQDINLMQVPDNNYIEYLRKNSNNENSVPEALIEQYRTKKAIDSFEPMKNELLQRVTTTMLRTFDDSDKVSSLLAMNKQERAKTIRSLIS